MTMTDTPSSLRILVDADACPVKDEIYKVAWRHEVPVTIVANSHFRIPVHPLISRVVVSDGFDAADDWIAEQADAKTVVVTGDILLADRCLKSGRDGAGPHRQAVHHREHRRRDRHASDHGGFASWRRRGRRPGGLYQGGPLAVPARAG